MGGEGNTEVLNREAEDGGNPTTERRMADGRLDRIFDALATERRRLVVQYFRNASDDVATVTDLAYYASDRLADGDFGRVSAALYHGDVPKLRDSGLVEYDPRTETVEFVGPEFVFALLDRADGRAADEDSTAANARAVGHLHDALATDDPTEKNYLVREALQFVHLDSGR